jgi:hypothetical protein
MEVIRTIYPSGPESIEVPPEFRSRPIEVIILPIDQPSNSASWSHRLISEVFGSWEGGLLVREPQPSIESREEIT